MSNLPNQSKQTKPSSFTWESDTNYIDSSSSLDDDPLFQDPLRVANIQNNKNPHPEKDWLFADPQEVSNFLHSKQSITLQSDDSISDNDPLFNSPVYLTKRKKSDNSFSSTVHKTSHISSSTVPHIPKTSSQRNPIKIKHTYDLVRLPPILNRTPSPPLILPKYRPIKSNIREYYWPLFGFQLERTNWNVLIESTAEIA